MRLKSATYVGYKRYTEMTISDIPDETRLVVLAGPNGTGKSSIFDGFRTWHGTNGSQAVWDESYGHKVGTPDQSWNTRVSLSFHEPLPTDPNELKKLVYIRSAFRNEADFQSQSFQRAASPLDSPRITRLIDNDVSVSDNYQRLIMQTIDGVFDTNIPDSATKAELRDHVLGQVRDAMAEVFPDLLLAGLGGVGSEANAGTFQFDKGTSSGFLFKNLSGGEKAAFDLILDVVVKSQFYDNSIWCIDEPEIHLNTRVQAKLLQTILNLIPVNSQLWIASHSLGFMRKAWELARATPGSVAFLDLQDVDFDRPAFLSPIQPSREFWRRMLDVAMGDLAELVAPERLVLCEGRPPHGERDGKAEFDAKCYRQIFAAEFPDTDFLSVGNSNDAGADRLQIGSAIQALASGTAVVRLIDRDLRSDEETRVLVESGVRVLSRRHIESYLLDDEVLTALCTVNGQPERAAEALTIKSEELAASVARGNDSDDLKSAGGSIYNRLRALLALTGAGASWNAFARDTLAPLVLPDMAVYADLRQDIFA